MRGRNGTEIAALGEEEAEKAVGILIATTLPGLMRLSEEDGSIQHIFEVTELSEFRAIVQRKAENRHSTESGKDRAACISGRTGRNRIATEEARFAIDQGNSSTFSPSANDRVAFPITNTLVSESRST